MNTCRTCQHWLPNDKQQGGICTLAEIGGSPIRDHAVRGEFFALCGGFIAVLHTGPDFGCNRWRKFEEPVVTAAEALPLTAEMSERMGQAMKANGVEP